MICILRDCSGSVLVLLLGSSILEAGTMGKRAALEATPVAKAKAKAKSKAALEVAPVASGIEAARHEQQKRLYSALTYIGVHDTAETIAAKQEATFKQKTTL